MTEKQMYMKMPGRVAGVGATAALLAMAAWTAAGQAQSQFPVPTGNFPSAPQLQLPALPTQQPITPNGQVVEDVIARVNDQIITRSEYERSEQGLLQSAQQQHESQADLDEQQKNLLRDMIDQQILLSKGKELGITGDAETMRQLDDIRKQNHLDSMEALQHAAEQQGVSFEDFKQNIREHIITQEVVSSEVGRHLNMTHAQEEAYYEAHKQDFALPEQVHLSEILIPTPENASAAQIAAAQARADDTSAKLKAGDSFAELAKTVSGGPTASAGGDLGDFKRGTLGQVLEDATFPLPVGGVTAPIRTRQGFVILRVDSHQQPGVPPLDKVESQVQQAVYMDAMQPALRAYLTKARNEAYIDIKPGFVDSGSDKKNANTTFTAYAPPAPKKKVMQKQRVEQEKEVRAQEALAASRQRVAEKAAERAAENARKAGVKDVAMPVRQKKVRREKIRYGQAPRANAATAQTVTTTEAGTPLEGQAPGVAMAPTESVTSVTTGTGYAAANNDDPLASREANDRKSRFSDREREAEEKRLKVKVEKTHERAQARPLTASTDEKADEQQQHGALGLKGDTSKKKKKRQKGDPKERLQTQPVKPVDPTVTPAPTVNPNLTANPVQPSGTTTQPATPPASK